MTSIIDASTPCDSKASALSAAGIRTIIRYYSRDTVHPSKRLSRYEAEKLAAAGVRLGVVHDGRFGDRASNFDRASGVADALYARSYGAGAVGQPAGSTIYFGVDFDARPAEIRDRIIPYFKGVADAFAKPTGDPNYVIGVYGSGATCKAIIDAGLAQRAWLAQSKGWSGYTAFLKSGLWALSQAVPTKIAGVDCDPDTAGEGHDIGDFALPPTLVAAPTPSAALMRVNARSGLRLRYGPGVDFDSAKLLRLGTLVYPIKSVGPWTMVDLLGDGIADGLPMPSMCRS
jgi:hypothetical protein